MLATINAALLLTNEQHGKMSNEPHHDALSVPAAAISRDFTMSCTPQDELS